MSEQPEPATTLQEVARYLSVGEEPVYPAAKRRGHPRFKAVGPRRFERSDFGTWIGRQKQAAQNHVGEED